MSSAVTPSLSLSDARTRLEGGLERLEVIQPALEDFASLLGSPRWRTELAERHARLDLLARLAEPLAQDLENARRLHARSPCPALADLANRIQTQLLEITSRAKGHGIEAGSLPEVLASARKRALAELPVPLEEGEQVVSTFAVQSSVWWGSLLVGITLVVSAFLGDFPEHPWLMIALNLGGVLGAGALGVAMRQRHRGAGRLSLTTRRLLHESRSSDPVEVRLSELRPGTVRTSATGATLALTTPRKLKISGIVRGFELGPALELERWLAQRGAAGPDAPPRWSGLLVSSAGTTAVATAAPTLVLLSTGFAVLPVSTLLDLRYPLPDFFGAKLRVPIRLEAFFRGLKRLDPDEGERFLETLVRALNAQLVRERRVLRQHGYANRYGFDTGARVVWFEPSSYKLSTEVSEFVRGWDTRELGPGPSEAPSSSARGRPGATRP